MKLNFDYGTQTIEFQVIYRKRKTISIEIEAPNVISVIVPEKAKEDEILEIVKTKAKWITQKLYDIREMEYGKINKEYVNGESLLYMGRNYALQLIVDKDYKRPLVKLYHGKIYVTINENNEDRIKSSLEEWYRQKAMEKIEQRINYYKSYFNVKPKKIKVREQKKRWGSCNSKQELFFNWRCIMAPANILDYVVVHEMCHMVFMNHSNDFWDLLYKILPDYKIRKEWLKNNGIKFDL